MYFKNERKKLGDNEYKIADVSRASLKKKNDQDLK